MQHNVSTLIGPGCSQSITIAGHLATHWQLPLVTGVGDLVKDKHLFPTVTRLSYTVEKQSGKEFCMIALIISVTQFENSCMTSLTILACILDWPGQHRFSVQ